MDKVIQTLLKNYPQSKNVLWITLEIGRAHV